MKLSAAELLALSTLRGALEGASVVLTEGEIREAVETKLLQLRRETKKKKPGRKKAKQSKANQSSQLQYPISNINLVTPMIPLHFQAGQNLDCIIRGWYSDYAVESGVLLVQDVIGHDIQLTPRSWSIVDGEIHQSTVVNQDTWGTVKAWLVDHGYLDLAMWVGRIYATYDRNAPNQLARPFSYPPRLDPTEGAKLSQQMLSYTGNRRGYAHQQLTALNDLLTRALDHDEETPEPMADSDYFKVSDTLDQRITLVKETQSGKSIVTLTGYWAKLSEGDLLSVVDSDNTRYSVDVTHLTVGEEERTLIARQWPTAPESWKDVIAFFRNTGHVTLAEVLAATYSRRISHSVIDTWKGSSVEDTSLINLKAFGVDTRVTEAVAAFAKRYEGMHTPGGWVELPCLVWRDNEYDRKVHSGRLVLIDGEAAHVELEISKVDAQFAEVDTETLRVPLDELSIEEIPELGVCVGLHEPAGKHALRWHDLADSIVRLQGQNATGDLARAFLQMWVNPHRA